MGALNPGGFESSLLPNAIGPLTLSRLPPLFFCYQMNAAGTAWESESAGGQKCWLSASSPDNMLVNMSGRPNARYYIWVLYP